MALMNIVVLPPTQAAEACASGVIPKGWYKPSANAFELADGPENAQWYEERQAQGTFIVDSYWWEPVKTLLHETY